MLVQKGLRSLTTTKIAPIHPGEVLMEDFIEGFGITQHKLAVAIGVPPRRINDDRPWEAGDHGRHCYASLPLLRHNPGILDEPADALRA